jgi:hypothetical protein
MSADEVEAFMDSWVTFSRSRARDRLRASLALNRFNYGYERIRPEDRLIDYANALEALLLKEEEQQELSYRFALRGAALLSTDPRARETTYAWLRRAYQLRSDIVHGGEHEDPVSVGGDQLKFHEFVDRIEEYVRRAIWGFLTLTEVTSELRGISTLDQRILRGEFPSTQ